MNVRVVAATMEHAISLGPRLRASDEEECWAAIHMPAAKALRRSLLESVQAWAILLDEWCVAIVGVAPHHIDPRVGIVWLLASDAWDMGVGRWILRRRRKYVPWLFERYPALVNAVPTWNAKTIRMLEWLGFEFGSPHPSPITGELFVSFIGLRSKICVYPTCSCTHSDRCHGDGRRLGVHGDAGLEQRCEVERAAV